jgi:hypothetical protein
MRVEIMMLEDPPGWLSRCGLLRVLLRELLSHLGLRGQHQHGLEPSRRRLDSAAENA